MQHVSLTPGTLPIALKRGALLGATWVSTLAVGATAAEGVGDSPAVEGGLRFFATVLPQEVVEIERETTYTMLPDSSVTVDDEDALDDFDPPFRVGGEAHFAFSQPDSPLMFAGALSLSYSYRKLDELENDDAIFKQITNFQQFQDPSDSNRFLYNQIDGNDSLDLTLNDAMAHLKLGIGIKPAEVLRLDLMGIGGVGGTLAESDATLTRVVTLNGTPLPVTINPEGHDDEGLVYEYGGEAGFYIDANGLEIGLRAGWLRAEHELEVDIDRPLTPGGLYLGQIDKEELTLKSQGLYGGISLGFAF